MNIQERKDDLMTLLKSKEYRDAFVEASINIGVPSQIRVLRKQREWSQKKLGDESKMVQESISRIEDPTRGSVNLKTLLRLASAFDVGLMVRFVPFGEMIDWKLRLSVEALGVKCFDEDPYFKEQTEDVLNEARKALEAPAQREPSVYLIYDATRRKEPNLNELYASKQKENIAMVGVGR